MIFQSVIIPSLKHNNYSAQSDRGSNWQTWNKRFQ